MNIFCSHIKIDIHSQNNTELVTMNGYYSGTVPLVVLSHKFNHVTQNSMLQAHTISQYADYDHAGN